MRPLAHVYLATALLQLRNLEAAHMPSPRCSAFEERRISWISKRLDRFAAMLTSEITRTLALSSGLVFQDRGIHTLKGLPGQWRLFAYLADARSAEQQ
jgi:hypothetical protein